MGLSMSPRRGTLILAAAVAALLWSTQASATSISLSGSSLHGATGGLSVVDDGTGSYLVTWSIDFDGLDVKAAIKTNHADLTHVAFKAFDQIDSIVLLDPSIGDLYFPSNVNSGSNGCDTNGSKAGFVCVALTPVVDATNGGGFRAQFRVDGSLKEDGWSYRGKFGGAKGWVISESGTPIPEPSAALLFMLGAVVVARRARP